MSVLKTNKAKLIVLNHFRYKKRSIVVTELGMFHGYADVFAINKNRSTTEIEIKTAKSDLQSEMRSLERILDGGKINQPISKLNKHKNYLCPKPVFNKYNRTPTSTPNYFWFAVTPELTQVAMKWISRTHYGLYELDLENEEIKVIKRAKLINENLIDSDMLFTVMLRVSTENINLKTEQYNRMVST